MAVPALREDATSAIQPEYQSIEQKYARFDMFLRSLRSDIYPEKRTELHDYITANVWERVKQVYSFPAGSKVLDVGCGQGVALEHFAADNLDATGIAIGEDVDICRGKGLNAIEMDLSFLEFADESFDLVWCRHVLEHSIFPYFSLAETFRVLRPGGVLYMEVPAPDTAPRHQNNPNHYSVLGKSMWLQLIKRVGYSTITVSDVNFTVPVGPDLYWSFIAKKD